MTALVQPGAALDGVRPVNIARDLPGIARLIEVCFGDRLDRAGQSAIAEMRALGRSGALVRVLALLFRNLPGWQHGFVCERAGRIVGNVGAQAADSGPDTWLMANVAVHPDYRRRNIASDLMRAALEQAQRSGAVRAMLQVDEDNPAALAMYARLGFHKLTVRTLWERRPTPELPRRAPLPDGIELRHAQPGHWPLEKMLLQSLRAEGITWTAPLQVDTLRPTLGRSLQNLFDGRSEERWLALYGSEPAGWFYIARELGGPDQLRIVARPQWAAQLYPALLTAALARLGRRAWALDLEHPTGDADDLWISHNFRAVRTLRWLGINFSAAR
jgi:GNAT superfamily N-acetyltransferase